MPDNIDDKPALLQPDPEAIRRAIAGLELLPPRYGDQDPRSPLPPQDAGAEEEKMEFPAALQAAGQAQNAAGAIIRVAPQPQVQPIAAAELKENDNQNQQQ